MNFIFISPNFPANYWHFCRELKNNGVNVLGIGDAPFYDLTEDQRSSLTEYFKVQTLKIEDHGASAQQCIDDLTGVIKDRRLNDADFHIGEQRFGTHGRYI